MLLIAQNGNFGLLESDVRRPTNKVGRKSIFHAAEADQIGRVRASATATTVKIAPRSKRCSQKPTFLFTVTVRYKLLYDLFPSSDDLLNKCVAWTGSFGAPSLYLYSNAKFLLGRSVPWPAALRIQTAASRFLPG